MLTMDGARLGVRVLAGALVILALAPVPGCSKGQVVPELLEWSPPHQVRLLVHNDRDTPITLVADGATQTVDAAGSATLTIAVFMTVPSNEFERTVDGVAQRPRAGTGQLAFSPVGPAYITPDGANWKLTVRIAADEEWAIQLKPGDCLFDGTEKAIRIGAERPVRRVDLCR